MKNYFLNIAIALDQLLNAIRGGDPDETISSHCAKNQHVWYWRWLGVALEFVDPGHLKRSIERDEGKRSVWK